MATITKGEFAVSWTTPYSSLLESPEARMTTRAGYAASLGQTLRLPWDGQHPTWFWTRYVVSKGRIRPITADAAFDRVIPFRFVHSWMLSGPEGTDAQADVFVYPSTVSVVARVTATGEWPLEDFAAGLEALRNARTWGVDGQAAPANRNLDGLAADLSDEAARTLTDGALPAAGYQSVLTVGAASAGDGNAASFEVTDATVRACLAGLAGLGPPGKFDETKLLGENTKSDRGARIYALRDGHAIWHPEEIRKAAATDPIGSIGCLLHNHATLVTHIAALSGIVSWAAERLTSPGGIPVSVQGLVENAVTRLRLLHSGPIEQTYRAGIAKERIEPMLPSLTKVAAAL